MSLPEKKEVKGSTSFIKCSSHLAFPKQLYIIIRTVEA